MQMEPLSRSLSPSDPSPSFSWVWRGIEKQEDEDDVDLELGLDSTPLNNINNNQINHEQGLELVEVDRTAQRLRVKGDEQHSKSGGEEISRGAERKLLLGIMKNDSLNKDVGVPAQVGKSQAETNDYFNGQRRFENVEEDDLPAQPRPKRQIKSKPETIPVVQKRRNGLKHHVKLHQCPNCPYRTEKTRRMDAHLHLHEEASLGVPCPDCGWYLAPERLLLHRSIWHIPKISQKRIKTTAQLQVAPLLLNCARCPHKAKDITNYKRHQKVHDSGATACNECGIFVLPNSFIAHHVVCAPAIRNSLGKDEKLSGARSKGKMVNINDSFLGFISFNRGLLKRKQYGCLQCLYETLQLWRMQVHVELHEEASQAVLCEECGWLLPPDQLDAHRDVNHSAKELPSAPPTTAKLKCGECSYECNEKLKTRFETHVRGHRQVAGATRCEDCGCHLSPRLLKYHKYQYCRSRRTESCQESGASVGDLPARPYEPESEANDDENCVGVGEEDCEDEADDKEGAFG